MSRHKAKPISKCYTCKSGGVNPEASQVEIRSVWQKRSRKVLLELEKRAAFCDTLKGLLGENSTVHKPEPKDIPEIRDLDSCTTTEVTEVKKNNFGELAGPYRRLLQEQAVRNRKWSLLN